MFKKRTDPFLQLSVILAKNIQLLEAQSNKYTEVLTNSMQLISSSDEFFQRHGYYQSFKANLKWRDQYESFIPAINNAIRSFPCDSKMVSLAEQISLRRDELHTTTKGIAHFEDFSKTFGLLREKSLDLFWRILSARGFFRRNQAFYKWMLPDGSIYKEEPRNQKDAVYIKQFEKLMILVANRDFIEQSLSTKKYLEYQNDIIQSIPREKFRKCISTLNYSDKFTDKVSIFAAEIGYMVSPILHRSDSRNLSFALGSRTKTIAPDPNEYSLKFQHTIKEYSISKKNILLLYSDLSSTDKLLDFYD